MPLIAVAVAVAADVGAVAAGFTALSVVAAVGATISAIGAVTGNKDLTLAGGILGGIGAIGSLASSAGLFDGFGSSAAAGSTAATGATNAVGDAAGSFGDGDIINSFGSVTNPAETLTASVNGGGSATDSFLGSLGGSPGSVVQAASDTGAVSAFDSLVPQTSSSGSSGFINAPGPLASSSGGVTPSTNVIASAALDGSGQLAAAGDSGKGIFGKIGDVLTTPVGFSGLVQAGGALIKGFFDPVTPAQIQGYQAQAAANRAIASLQTQQQANIAAPKSVATSAPVTGAPAPLVPGAPMGFINAAIPQPPQQAPQVPA